MSTLTRREFLRVTGTGLVVAGVLEGAGCGGGQQGGVSQLTLSCWPDQTGTLQNQINRFNRQNKGEIRVGYRRLSPEGTKHYDQVRTELQGGGGDIDVIIGEVTWPTQFAATGWIVDLSDRFTLERALAHRHQLHLRVIGIAARPAWDRDHDSPRHSTVWPSPLR